MEVSGRPEIAARFAWLLGLALVCGCETATVAPVPTESQQAEAVVGALDGVVSRTLCDGAGTFWLDGEPWYQAMTGRSTGVAGVIEGLVAGVDRLEALDAATGEDHGADVARYVSVVRSSTQWLMAHARLDSDSGGVWWPACVADVVPVGPEGAPCREEIPVVSEETLVCAEGTERARPGLRYGVAGIGAMFLDLYEHPFFSPDEQAVFLEYAAGAGDWLLGHASDTDHGPCWLDPASAEGDPGECATSLSRGLAGVGWFLLRLSRDVQEGETYLGGAVAAADTLQSFMVPAGDGAAYVLPGDREGGALTGFYEGNAGVAYFLMALYQETGRSAYGSLARSVLEWLQSDEVFVPALDGATWLAGLDLPHLGPYTGWELGAAGIGWTFLQAARVFGPNPGTLESSYLEVAMRAATWLTHPEIAHYYQGLVWWPERDQPWSDTPLPPAPRLDTLDTTWAPAVRPWWEGASSRGYLAYTGLLRGGVGIGWFLLNLADALEGVHEVSCEQALFAEAASQALRWLYYRGMPSGDRDTWTWPTSFYQTVTARNYPGPATPGFELGVSGALSFLGAGVVPPESAGLVAPAPLGFPPLEYPER